MKIDKLKNFILLLTLIMIFLIDFGLIATTNNKWTISLFCLSNFTGILLLYLYRKEKIEYETTLYNEKEKAIITLKSIGDAVITTNEKAEITFINPIAQKILGYRNDEVVGENINKILNLIDIRTKKTINLNIKKVLEQGKIRILGDNTGLINKEEKIFEIEDSIAPIKDKKGNILGAVFVFHNVTKQNEYRRRLINNEKIMLQQSKISAMSEMLENMAHHWRQPLSLISTLATGIKARRELKDFDEEYLIESLNKINESSQSLSKIIDDFTVFLTPATRKKELFFMDEAVSKVLIMFESNLKSRDINVILTVEKFQYSGYLNELMQVFIGFINNSIDILESRKEKRYIFIDISKKNNEIVLEFLDNGGGIPNDIINRIFEPYFTTKYKSQGRGIGLYLTQEIVVNLMNGKIKVKNENFSFGNEAYCGAKFTIFLK